MSEGVTCYERDEELCEDQICIRTGCRLRHGSMTEKHSPLPWRGEIQYGPNGEGDYAWVYNDKNEMVCTAKLHHADSIIRYANSHSDLVAALEEIAGLKAEDMYHSEPPYHTAAAIARAALAKAKGGQNASS